MYWFCLTLKPLAHTLLWIKNFLTWLWKNKLPARKGRYKRRYFKSKCRWCLLQGPNENYDKVWCSHGALPPLARKQGGKNTCGLWGNSTWDIFKCSTKHGERKARGTGNIIRVFRFLDTRNLPRTFANITDHSLLSISIHDPILPRKVLHDSRYTGSYDRHANQMVTHSITQKSLF